MEESEGIIGEIVQLIHNNHFRTCQNHPDTGETLDYICELLREKGYVNWTTQQALDHQDKLDGG